MERLRSSHHHRMGKSILGIVWLVFLLTITPPVRAGEAHYVLVFGSQRIPNRPKYSHSFATFVHAKWEGDQYPPVNPTLKVHTISWLPASGEIHVHPFRPEKGRNYTLAETFAFADRVGARVSLWGPFPVKKDLYDQALEQLADLESGKVLYKANDIGRRSDRVSNCIHAVSTALFGPRLRVACPGWGEVASFAILLRLRPYILDRTPHYWVSSALGLNSYPIIYREGMSPPFSGMVFGPLFRLVGGERNLRPRYGPPTSPGQISPCPCPLPLPSPLTVPGTVPPENSPITPPGGLLPPRLDPDF